MLRWDILNRIAAHVNATVTAVVAEASAEAPVPAVAAVGIVVALAVPLFGLFTDNPAIVVI